MLIKSLNQVEKKMAKNQRKKDKKKKNKKLNLSGQSSVRRFRRKVENDTRISCKGKNRINPDANDENTGDKSHLAFQLVLPLSFKTSQK